MNRKIKNNNKFKIMPTAVTKKQDIIINNTKIIYSDQGKVLGLTITRTGYGKHIKENKNKSIRAINELHYFYNLPTNIKIHLIKAYILPIIRYPTIPLVTISRSNKRILQVIQNKALRFAFNEKRPYTRDTKTLHELAKLDPVNLYLHNQAKQILNKMQTPHYEEFSNILENYEENLNHVWFRKKKNILEEGEPERRYTYD